MKKWLRKSFVALITILTFGTITPYQIASASNEPINKPEKDDIFESGLTNLQQTNLEYNLEEPLREKFLNYAFETAEYQSYLKFGTRIAPVIENEFQEIILPKIEQAISSVIEQFDEEDLTQLGVSEVPGKGVSEKMFHITHLETNQDIIRFHVRRDLRPLEGYWFNFHYHTYHDNYQTHYELGEIFWDKNTPPNWMN